MHRAVVFYLEKWPGGDPDEQVAMLALKGQLDKLMLETMIDM